jgi:hypothetical protein
MLAFSILENFQVQAQIQNPWITLVPVHKVPDRIMLIQDFSSTTGYYTTRDYFMSLKVHANSKCSSLDMTLHRLDTLVTTRLWSWYLETFGGPKCGKL